MIATRPSSFAGWAALGLGLVACQATETWPSPPLDGAGSLVLLVERNAIPERAYVLEADTSLPGLVLSDEGGEVRVYVWLYDESLKILGIIEGEIDLSAASSPAPRPKRSFELRAPYDSWRATDADEIFDRLSLPRRDGFCDPYEGYTRVDIDAKDSTAPGPFFTEERRLGSLLVGNHSGVWEVGAGYAYPIIGPAATSTIGPPDLATNPIVAAHWDRLPPGQHFYYQADGNLWRSRVDIPFEWVGRNPGAGNSTYAWLAGSGDRGPFELYILDDRGSVWLYDDEGWSPIREPTEPEDLGDQGGLAWIGPHDVMMIGAGGRVLRLRDGSTDDITPAGMARPTILLNEYLVGVSLGDSAGQLWRSVGGEWTKLASTNDGPVLTIGPHKGGYLFGGSGGTLHYFRDGQPGCDLPISAPNPIFRAAHLYEGETLLLSSSAYLGAPGPITVTALVPTRD